MACFTHLLSAVYFGVHINRLQHSHCICKHVHEPIFVAHENVVQMHIYQQNLLQYKRFTRNIHF